MRMRYAVMADPAVLGDERRWAVVLNDKLLAQFESADAAVNYARTLALLDTHVGRGATVEIDGHLVDFRC